ncbi:hypothetical protein CL1_0145 [Thermococcus cleftensis]|uniref:Uncharacterized protein n=1 Tax=Thermococcus cleftensis (strain DSM 27260 / KACC 17922 / CL1) TaxID=163003 RepID=I3ZRM6_THECF|nr:MULTISPECIES: hypothetical protein [Thermococcus]AFL94360.1 hypothetical protein CL1_0145 [Thermococcus cleftensis]NJE01088.1 hypothetical protein [Thermococcus sp. JdF3]
MGEIVIRVNVPEGYEESFKKEVEEMAKYLRNREKLRKNMEKLFGILKTDKTWKEMKREMHEERLARYLDSY